MYLPLTVILSVALSVCQVSCQNGNYEYTEQRPWTFVYSLYPFYNSETLLEVWKSDKSIDISTNVVTLSPNEQGRTVLYSDDVTRPNNTDLKTQKSTQYFVDATANANAEQLSANRQRLSSYRNRRKDSTSQTE